MLQIKFEPRDRFDEMNLAIQRWLSQNHVPFSLIKSLLLLAPQFFHSKKFFFERSKDFLDYSYPPSIRISIGKAIDCCSGSIIKSSFELIDLAIIIDHLILDDDENVRTTAVKVVSKFLNAKV
jgi:hypothetical protein